MDSQESRGDCYPIVSREVTQRGGEIPRESIAGLQKQKKPTRCKTQQRGSADPTDSGPDPAHYPERHQKKNEVPVLIQMDW